VNLLFHFQVAVQKILNSGRDALLVSLYDIIHNCYNTKNSLFDTIIIPISKKEAELIWSKSDDKLLYRDRQDLNRLQQELSNNKNDIKITSLMSNLEYRIDEIKKSEIDGFIEKNKEYEQSKKIIEKWKKINNIKYNPEEVYSRGQEFISVVGAYSKFDVNLMMQNLLQHVEDNQKAGGEFTISAITKPVDRKIGHLEGDGGKIRFKIFPKSEDIKWAANTDVYSGSVWDASEKVNKDKKSELLGVSYSKYPSLNNVNAVQPNLASIIENLDHHHNELGITLTGKNFRLEYDDNIPNSTKKIIDSVNSILDQKYGKVEKPNIEKTKNVIQPTQTNENLKESIDNIIDKIMPYTTGKLVDKDKFTVVSQKEFDEAVTKGKKGYAFGTTSFGYSETFEYDGYVYTQIDTNKLGEDFYGKIKADKEYTEQALINTKIAALKEVAKKYPRSLIRSEVKKAEVYRGSMFDEGSMFDPSELSFQKIPSVQNTDVVLAPNGKVSTLFKSIQELEGVNSREQALEIYNKTKSPEFKKWFGQSRVTDRNGEPLMVYHGTGNLFSEFNKELRGITTGKSIDGSFDAENAFFFTTNNSVAFHYSLMNRDNDILLITKYLEAVAYPDYEFKEKYANFRKDYPEFANYIDNLKKEGFDKNQIIDKLKILYEKYRKLSIEDNSRTIANRTRNHKENLKNITTLNSVKSQILNTDNKYEKTIKDSVRASYYKNRDSQTPTNEIIINDEGIIRVIKDDTLNYLNNKNIKEISSSDFDLLINKMKKVTELSLNQVLDVIKNAKYTPHVMPVFLSASNVLRKDFQGQPFVMQMDGSGAYDAVSKLVLQAVNENKDGVIIENIKDPELATNYAIFEPNQIKSVFNEGEFSKEKNNIYYSKSNVSEEVVDNKLNDKLTSFLTKAGIKVNALDRIVDDEGNEVVAKVAFLHKVIDIVLGKADIYTLPEEAAHVFLEMLPNHHPLKIQILKEITSDPVYAETLKEYKSDKQYRNADGTINFEKIKLEAAGKLIAQHIVSKEKSKAKSWFEKLIDFIRKMFSGVKENPFEEVAKKILKAEIAELDTNVQSENIYYSKSPVEKSIDKLVADQKILTLDEETHIYKLQLPAGDVKDITLSVTSVDKKEFKGSSDPVWSQIGTAIHKDFESEIKFYLDSDGNITGNRTVTPNFKPETNDKVYKEIQDYVADFIALHKDKNVKIFPELRIYDPEYNLGNGLAGTIDLLVVYPDGSYDKYDWKSLKNLGSEKYVDEEKKDKYKKQSDLLSKILAKQYGLTDRRKDYMIPIVINVDANNNLKTIEMAKANYYAKIDPKKKKTYLSPIIIHYKESDDDRLNDLITELNKTKKHILDFSTQDAEKASARAKVKQIEEVIEDIIFQKDIRSLAEFIRRELNFVSTAIVKNDRSVRLKPYIERIQNTYAPSSLFIESRLKEIEERLKDPNLTPAKRVSLENAVADFKSVIVDCASVLKLIDDYSVKTAQSLADIADLGDNTSAERELGFLESLTTVMSQTETINAQIFSQLFFEAQTQSRLKAEIAINNLSALQNTMISEFRLTKKNIIPFYKKTFLTTDKKGNLRLIQNYNLDFYNERETAASKKDVKWFIANTTFDKERYKKKLNAFKEVLSKRFEYGAISEDRMKQEIYEFDQKWNPRPVIDSKGVLTFKNEKALFSGAKNRNYLMMPQEKWYSEEYKTIINNPTLKAYYDNIIEINQSLADQGLIEESKIHSFVPKMSTKFFEAFFAKQSPSVKEAIGSGFILTEDQVNVTAVLNPITGDPREDITVMFTENLTNKDRHVEDLGFLYATMIQQMTRYEELIKILPETELLLIAEKQKKLMVTDKFYNPVQGQEKENTTNFKVLKALSDYMLYGNLSAKDIKALIPVNKFTTLLGIGGKNWSAAKTLETIMLYNVALRLGLNLSSIAANLVGSQSNINFLASAKLIFDMSHLNKGRVAVMQRDPKLKKMIEFFDIYVDDKKMQDLTSKVKSDNMQYSPAELILSPQRKTDEVSQETIAAAALFAFMPYKGEIVNIRKHVYRNSEYDSLSVAEKEEKIKELSDSSSLFVTGKLDDNGEVYWENPDGSRIDFKTKKKLISPLTSFSRQVKSITNKSTGAVSKDDKSMLQTMPLFRPFLQFRNFIAPLVKSRTMRVQYDAVTDTMVQGRYRLFFKEMLQNTSAAIQAMLFFGGNTETNPSINAAAEKAYYRDKESYEKNTNKEFKMSKQEYFMTYVANMRSMGTEIMFVVAFFLLLSLIKAGDDDTDEERARIAFTRKFLKKFYNEFSFYVDPREFQQLFSNSLPLISMFSDVQKIITNLIRELSDDPEVRKRAHPLKYTLNMIPMGKQVQEIIALFSDDFRKEMGITYKRASIF
jgi:hypothetical protein